MRSSIVFPFHSILSIFILFSRNLFWHNIAYECIIQQIESEFTLKILALYTKNAKRTLDVSDKLTYLDLAHIQNMRHALFGFSICPYGRILFLIAHKRISLFRQAEPACAIVFRLVEIPDRQKIILQQYGYRVPDLLFRKVWERITECGDARIHPCLPKMDVASVPLVRANPECDVVEDYGSLYSDLLGNARVEVVSQLLTPQLCLIMPS